jgi:type VI secretion system secreted protein Hcp
MRRHGSGVFAVVGLVCLMASTFAARAEDKTYVQIPGIPGESTDAAHGTWIDAYGLDWNVTVPTSGGGTGVPAFNPVSILKGTDKASPLLLNATALSTTLNPVVIEVCRQTAPQQCYFKVELSNSKLTRLDLSGSSCVGTGACTPTQTESVSFNYTRIKWTYTPFTGGTPGTPVARCWDLLSNTAC